MNAAPDRMPTEVLLSVDVPPVTHEIKQLIVRCGHTTVVVKQDNDAGWRAWADGYFVTPPRYADYEAAVADAYQWAHGRERNRLLSNALTETVERWVGADAKPRRPVCEMCDRGLCAVGAEDPCPGCCACVGHCLGEAEADSSGDGEPRG
jgi:hypothetical protein